MHRFGIQVIVTALLSILWIHPAMAGAPPLDPVVAAQVTTLTQQELAKAEARLEKQAESRFEQVRYAFDETQKSFKWLVDWAFGILCGMIAIGFVLFWRNEKSLKDVLEKREENFNKKVDGLEQKYKDKLRDAEEKADQSIQKLKTVENMYTRVQEDIDLLQELENKLKPLTEYTEKQIIWAFETIELDTEVEIAEIRAEGFKRIKRWRVGEKSPPSPDKCDFMIYAFKKSDKSVDQLKKVLEYLKSTGREVPLIIYTYYAAGNLVRGEELNVIAEYRNHIMANLPLTLKSYFNSLIRL